MPDDAAFTWDTPGRPKPRVAPPAHLPAGGPGDEPTALEEPPAGVPDSHLLVPRDAFDKILSQLGNLHDAGQQLAEARERAAKAETEVTFLRERLAEMRERLEPPDPPEPPPPEPTPSPPDTLTARLTSVWRALRGS